jgi:prevent-host-death family protein
MSAARAASAISMRSSSASDRTGGGNISTLPSSSSYWMVLPSTAADGQSCFANSTSSVSLASRRARRSDGPCWAPSRTVEAKAVTRRCIRSDSLPRGLGQVVTFVVMGTPVRTSAKARPAQNVKSVSEFKKQIRAVFARLHQTGRPVVITINGRPDVVLLDAAVFEQRLSTLNLQALLAEGEADVSAGRTRSARAAVKALRGAGSSSSG